MSASLGYNLITGNGSLRQPSGSKLKVYKAEKDEVADAVSAVLIYKGLKTSERKPVEVAMINSDLHVFTRLAQRLPVPFPQDLENQRLAFEDIATRLIQ